MCQSEDITVTFLLLEQSKSRKHHSKTRKQKVTEMFTVRIITNKHIKY